MVCTRRHERGANSLVVSLDCILLLFFENWSVIILYLLTLLVYSIKKN